MADLEQALGIRLIAPSMRSLREINVGSEVLEHGQRSAEISEAIDNIESYVEGLWHIPAFGPCGISD